MTSGNACEATAATCAKIRLAVLPLRDAGTELEQIARSAHASGETSSNWRRQIAARDSVDLRWTQNRLMLPAGWARVPALQSGGRR